MYYFIVNPNSRCGRGRNIWKKVERMLKASYTEYQAFFYGEAGRCQKICQRADGRLQGFKRYHRCRRRRDCK